MTREKTKELAEKLLKNVFPEIPEEELPDMVEEIANEAEQQEKTE